MHNNYVVELIHFMIALERSGSHDFGSEGFDCAAITFYRPSDSEICAMLVVLTKCKVDFIGLRYFHLQNVLRMF